jgi:uncharacterized protein (UPF0335 family)
MSNLAKRLLSAEFGGYPAHGSGFVTILSAYELGANIKDDLRAAHDRIEALEAALADALSGLRYVRRIYPDVTGVGFDRCEAYQSLLSEHTK